MHPLKAARKDRGLSLCQVGIKLGLPGSAKNQAEQVNRWERGTSVPRSDRAEKLASIFGFQSGEKVQEMCHEWKQEHVPKKKKVKKNVPKERNRKRRIDPFDRKEKLHPIREYREICGFTQEILAVKLGFQNSKHGRTRISHWENGDNVPSYGQAEKLAAILGFESAEEVQQVCHEWRNQYVSKEG